jgi:predicted  nucleic acid-binding Zn-ribbon protein
MKNNRIFTFTLILFTAVFFAACDNREEELQKELEELKAEKMQMEQQLSGKDSSLQEFIHTFNEIQDNIKAIKEKEKIVNVNVSDGENDASAKEQLAKDLQWINQLLEENKQKINYLASKLKSSDSKLNKANKQIAELNKFIENLTAQIQEKDKQIAELQQRLLQSDEELRFLFEQYNERVAELDSTVKELNKAFYCIGTYKELKDNGVITKEGGFIGLGKIAKLKDDFNKDYFTEVNIEEENVIPLMVKEIKIITTHPKDSYELETDGNTVKALKINNPKRFWSVSKYLVIQVVKV